MKQTLLGYVPEESPVYQLHPFTRLFAIFSFTLVPLFLLDPLFNGPLLIFTLLLFPLSRIRFSVFKIYLPVILILFIFINLVYLFFPEPEMQKTVFYRLSGEIIFYREALVYAGMVYLRIITVLLLTIYFLHVMTESEIVVALRSVRVPFIICYTLGLSFRAIGMFLADYRTIREAEQARALSFRDLPVHKKITRLINYVVPLLALMIRRTDEFSDAILSRGFSFKGMSSRPNYLGRKFSFSILDFLIMFTATVITILMIIWGLEII